ncbi:hypothetical protein HF086_001876 [Spodoptera exigua]|uniref:C2 domain-containing protein n=1 Tax=Spodoptera exigua TaxID=7107 RepID=A0A922S8J9_SPOEX|nr:hypothetical protein HF086_001876 [Spodoptera exigua]
MSRKPRSGNKSNLSQFGLIDIPDINDDDEPLDLSDDDFDLEAELAAISGGGGQRQKPRKPPPVPAANLDAMIAESLKDIPSDDEGSAIDDDEAPAPPPRTSRPAPPPPGAPLSTDSSTISLLQDRITNYTVAEKNAKSNGESSRARRFGRGLKTLQDLLKQAKAGKPIKNEDIPPPVAVGKPAGQSDAPQPPAAEASPPEQPLIDLGPPEPEPSPPSPPEPTPVVPEPSQSTGNDRQRELQIILNRQAEFKAEALAAKKNGDKFLALGFLKVTKQFDTVVEAHKTPAEDTSGGGGGGLIMASTLGEGLHQRLEAFKKQEAKAKEEGNSSKARRMNRIIKQYADAIKRHEAGHPIDVEELPAPAGYGPLPTGNAPKPSPSPARATPAPSEPSPSTGQSARRDQIVALLIKRQTQFKEAALLHKKKGEVDMALQYLRNAKRFDPLIEAAKAGKTIDLSNLPALPRPTTSNKATIHTEASGDSSLLDSSSTDEPSGASHDGWVDVGAMVGGTSEDGSTSLLNQLESQGKMAKEYMKHCKNMGHVAEAKMYEKLAETVKEDLDVLRVAVLNNRGLPNFHYVTREFSITQCNTDLGVNDLELTIVRGIAYNVAKDIDTYVRFEFPFPQEAPVSDRTDVVKNSNSPEYNAVFPLAINRNRACQRVFKRHGIKLEVWSKGRAVGGSLEVKVRVRTPILQQEVKTEKHRWLVLDDV